MNKKRYEVYYKTKNFERAYYYNTLTFANLRYRNILMNYINISINNSNSLVLHIYDYKLHKFKDYINISKNITK